MKYIQFILLLIIALATSCNSDQIKIGPKDLAIQNVSIVDVKTGEFWNNMSLIIRGNKIDTIGKSADFRLSGSDKWVDGSGKYLIPGLWDMHAHLFNEPDIRNVGYPLFIANGITGIRIMAADCLDPPCEDPNMTIDQYRRLQNEIKAGQLLGPKSILASDYINGTLKGESTVLKPRTEEHGRQLARLLKDRQVDFIKIYDVLTPEAYYGITDEATKSKLEFAGHVPLTVKASTASITGQKSIEHIFAMLLECSDVEDEMREKFIELFTDKHGNVSYWNANHANDLMLEVVKNYNPIKCQELYKTLRKNFTWFVPTLHHIELYYPDAEDWKKSPNIKYMPKAEYDFFVNEYEPAMRALHSPYHPEIEKMRIQFIVEAQKSGVGILAGSDVAEVGLVHGFSLHNELASLQNAGLTPLEVLQTATVNPAKYQNAIDSIGTIETGKIADLILLNKNPLEDIRNTQEIEAVFTNGIYLNRKDLDSLLLGVENYIKNEN
jgi:hypothetical protein